MELFESLPVAVKPEKKEKCGWCAHIQRWECGRKFFYYCGIQKSNRTENGLLKVKYKSTACDMFEINRRL
jgi:hypothetical protein